MTVTERLMRVSTGSLSFRTGVPQSITDAIRGLVDERASGVGAHVVITNAPIDPSAIGDTAALGLARYTGRITKRPTRTSLEFDGLETWLDTYLDADTSRVAGTPSQWLSDLLTNDLTAGTVTATGTTNVTRSFPAHITTRREALDVVAGLGGWEWKVRPNFTIDAAVKSTLFRSPPNIVVTRKSEGPDNPYRGVRGGMLDQSIDVSNLATKAVALAQGEGTAIAKGTATTSRSLRAPKGSAASFVTVFSAPSEESANANTAAQNFLNLQGARFDISVNSTTHDIPTYVRPGDEVYLYDLAAGIVDTSNQIQFRGETIFPAKVRCLELTWPIEEGCGVYIRSNAATPTWIDVTPWVEWESGDSWWKVGDWSPPSYGRANRSNPEVEDRIGSGSGNVAIGGALTVSGSATVGGAAVATYQKSTYTPTLPQFPVTHTVNWARWNKLGNLIRVSVGITCGGAGFAGDALISVPFAFASGTPAYESVGVGRWYDASAGAHRVVEVRRNNTDNAVQMVIDSGGVLQGSQLASPDDIRISFIYEWA